MAIGTTADTGADGEKLAAAVQVAYVGATWSFAGALMVQVFLAGLGVFVGPAEFRLHALFAGVVAASLAVTAILGVVSRVGAKDRGLLRLTWVLVGLLLVQGGLVHLRGVSPVIAAFHPVNALLMFYVAVTVAIRARRLLRPVSAERVGTRTEATAAEGAVFVAAPHLPLATG